MLCGHRGSGRGIVGGHRENTLGSFRAAVAAGLRCVDRLVVDEPAAWTPLARAERTAGGRA